MKVTNIEIVTKWEGTDSTAVLVTVARGKESVELCDWLDEDGLVERVDSNIRINQHKEAATLLHGTDKELSDIYDAIDEALKQCTAQMIEYGLSPTRVEELGTFA